jgi:hypothetical protein
LGAERQAIEMDRHELSESLRFFATIARGVVLRLKSPLDFELDWEVIVLRFKI